MPQIIEQDRPKKVFIQPIQPDHAVKIVARLLIRMDGGKTVHPGLMLDYVRQACDLLDVHPSMIDTDRVINKLLVGS